MIELWLSKRNTIKQNNHSTSLINTTTKILVINIRFIPIKHVMGVYCLIRLWKKRNSNLKCQLQFTLKFKRMKRKDYNFIVILENQLKNLELRREWHYLRYLLKNLKREEKKRKNLNLKIEIWMIHLNIKYLTKQDLSKCSMIKKHMNQQWRESKNMLNSLALIPTTHNKSSSII